MRSRVLLSALVLASVVLACAGGLRIRPAEAEGSQSRVKIGLRIAPVSLNLRHKNRELVGLGSYIVNAQGGCNDCHTNPSYAPGGDPSQGQPEQINTDNYLAGGRGFGPGLTSPNITPDKNGLPGGLTLEAFLHTIHTGQDPDDPNRLLQVMPWAVYSKMNNQDLRAVYEYLRAIPHAEPANPD
jgi:hypothetical protein